jgi:hypothetical protein
MPYYMAGDYYASGGVWSTIGTIASGALRGVASLVPGGSVLAGIAGGLVAPQRQLPQINPPFAGPPGVGIIRPGGTSIGIGQPGQADLRPGGKWVTKSGKLRRIRRDGHPWKRPTMDPGNVRALRRSSRRIDRFVGIARRAFRHTNYKVASKSSRARRK